MITLGSKRSRPLRPRWPISVLDYTMTNALGLGRAAFKEGLLSHRSGLRPCDIDGVDFITAIGRVDGIEQHPLPDAFKAYEGRNNRLAHLALMQDGFMPRVDELRRSLGAHRMGVLLGTSTSGILETEQAYTRRDPVSGALPSDFRYRETQNTFATAHFIREILQLRGPALTVSTACSSSAKIFANAARWLEADLCDAVIVGGVDSLCLTTLFGFHSLELLSKNPSKPCAIDRDGISIGEAAGFAILTHHHREDGSLAVLGAGESSDAHHMSSPHPEGLGAAIAMRACLNAAQIDSNDVDFILLHGTATRTNDIAEDRGILKVLGEAKNAASIKGHIGHTLGAAGIMNALSACLALEGQFTPGTLHTQTVDPLIRSHVALEPSIHAPTSIILSNAFGFGGSNACLLLGRDQHGR